MRRLRCLGSCLPAALLALGLLARPAAAASFIPPTSYGELALASDAVVLVEAHASSTSERGALIFTTTECVVVESLAGAPGVGDRILVESPGGKAPSGEEWIVEGAARFESGAEYLLALQKKPERDLWIPTMLSWGVFRAVVYEGEEWLVPDGVLATESGISRQDGAAVDPLRTHRKLTWLPYLRSVLEGREIYSSARFSVVEGSGEGSGDGVGGADGAVAGAPAGCSFFESGGRKYRWRNFDSGGSATIFTDPVGDLSLSNLGFPLMQEAMDLWMDITDSGVNLRYGGAREVDLGCSSGQDSASGFVVFNDPCSDIGDLSGCGGVLAFGGPRASGTHTFDGQSWLSITSWIVVVNNGAGCLGNNNYRIMMAHELGHGLGYGHVDDSGALMYANCCRSPNATDRTCGRFTYPPEDTANARPEADAGGNRTLRLASNRARFEGSVTDDGPLASIDTTWTQLVGPGTVTFDDASSLSTLATFSRSGTYLLGLEAYDGSLLHIDTITVDVEVQSGLLETFVFEQGVGGYSGTVDTRIEENAPGSSYGNASTLGADADDPGDSGLEVQTLLRFGGIFGGGASQIAPGRSIASADLTLASTNNGDGAALYRLTAPFTESSTWSSLGNGIQVATETVGSIDAQASGVAELVTIDVTQSLSAWSLDPSANEGWAFLPLGDDGWDVSSSEGDMPPRLEVRSPIFQTRTLVELGEEWDYLRGTSAPAADWVRVDFEPGAAWRQGPTGIGFGDGDDATVLSDMRGNYATVYARRVFEVTEPGLIADPVLRIDYDDGFIAYLNGVEIARVGLGAPGSPVGPNSLAASHEAGSFEEFRIDPSAFQAGTNCLAIEVHNATLDSSDLSLRPELVVSELLVSPSDVWRYQRGRQSIPADWASLSFDDSSWELGETSIGYGDGDDITELADMQGQYASVFCRRTFELECPEAVEELRLNVLYDDGVVVYLNGTEVRRANMPAGPVTRATLAASSGETELLSVRIPTSRLRAGENVLAVSVHNASLGSSDLSFSALLVPDLADDFPCAPTAGRFLRGDAEPDGEVDVSDAVRILVTLFASGDPLDCPDAADIDDDGVVRINDPVALLGFLFQGGTAPAAPGVSCGVDPTDDSLPECESGC